jgi:glucose/arabinose dehydrogenase
LRSFIVIFALICIAAPLAAQPCAERPQRVESPVVDGGRFCLELAMQDDSGGELSFTTLSVGPDGALYAARPLAGEIYRLTDSDGDALPDTPVLLVDGLTLPTGLGWDGDALYIFAADSLYRWQDDALVVISDALPYSEYGPWNGGLAVSPDGDVFMGISAGCDYCVPEAGFGTIMRYNPRADSVTVYAEGFRQPAALVWHDFALWASDTIRDAITFRYRDEFNRVMPEAHYGFPYCYGVQNVRDTLAGDFDCAQVTPPDLIFPARSGPWGAASYSGDAFPYLEGLMLVALSGQPAMSSAYGYGLLAVDSRLGTDGADATFLIPSSPQYAVSHAINSDLQPRGMGFYPRHIYGVAVSPEGWIYVSAGGGRIFVLRQP